MAFSIGSGAVVRVDTPTGEGLLAGLEADLTEGRPFAVATLNLDHLVKLRASEKFRRAYARQTHVVADGHPVVWLARLAGHRIRLVPGSELIEPLAALAARIDAPVALLGATEATLAAAAARLEARHPGLRIVARVAPPFGMDVEGPEGDACLEAVRRSGARLCFIALGAPKQEVLAARALDGAVPCGFVSVGAGLDFIAGAQRRAPALVRRLAMEWLWRMASDPRRLARRYLACGLLLPRLALEAWRTRWAPPRGEEPEIRSEPGKGGMPLAPLGHR